MANMEIKFEYGQKVTDRVTGYHADAEYYFCPNCGAFTRSKENTK